MSDAQYVQLEPPKHQTWHMYRAMVGIGLVCAIIIVSVFQYTLPIIKQNKLELLEKALYQITPDARQFQRYQLQDDGKFIQVNEDIEDNVVYAMYNADKFLLGTVITAKGMGYQDLIEMLYGYQPDQQIISGYQILSSRETPGLGTKIETDKTFQQNFVALDAKVNAGVNDLQNPIEVVKPGTKTQAWQIDTITGATISSKAVGKMVSNSAGQWIPKIHQRLKDFQQ
jgi:Na+-translocating ferredoxin:NAD+ oxidoreductase subunit G